MTRLTQILISACVVLSTMTVVRAQPFPAPPTGAPNNTFQPGSGFSYPSTQPPFAGSSGGRPAGLANQPRGTNFSPPDFGANRPPGAPPQNQPPQRAKRDLFEPAKILAFVGDQPIMVGDVVGPINQLLEQYEGKMPADVLEQQREKLIRSSLKTAIDNKLMYLDFLRDFPDESKLPEVEDNLLEQFDKKQLPELLERVGVNTPGEYDIKMRRYGSSLAKAKQRFLEQVFAQQSIFKHVDSNPEVSHQEMLDEYQRTLDDYAVPAKVRFEQLVVRFEKYNTKNDAGRAIADMGNRVLQGAQFAEVARNGSQGFKAKDGGYHDWTSQGSLVSEALDEQLFQLPVAKLSKIIEDKTGLYIVRVLERQSARHVPFTEAQVEIEKRLRKEKVEAQREAYIAQIRSNGAKVWTIFDDENEGEDRTAGSDDRQGPGLSPR